jgi:hypothetical protein
MQNRRGGIVLAAAVFVAFGAACGGDEPEAEAFDLSGRVVSVEPGAQPADNPTDADFIGAIVIQSAQPADCETDADGVRVYLADDASVTPSSASDDLDKLRGKTVDVSGDVTKDGDACTVIADSIATQSSDKSKDDMGDMDMDDMDMDDSGDSDPAGTSAPGATGQPDGDLDDAGNITDTKGSPIPDSDVDEENEEEGDR